MLMLIHPADQIACSMTNAKLPEAAVIHAAARSVAERLWSSWSEARWRELCRSSSAERSLPPHQPGVRRSSASANLRGRQAAGGGGARCDHSPAQPRGFLRTTSAPASRARLREASLPPVRTITRGQGSMSHEFRTPSDPAPGPIEDALADTGAPVACAAGAAVGSLAVVSTTRHGIA